MVLAVVGNLCISRGPLDANDLIVVRVNNEFVSKDGGMGFKVKVVTRVLSGGSINVVTLGHVQRHRGLYPVGAR